MTARSRWLVLLGICGFAIGIMLNKHTLAWLSLTTLLWIFVEWLRFYWQVWVELPQLRITRLINGQTEATRFLWAGRKVDVSVLITSANATIGGGIKIRECLPENLLVVDGSRQVSLFSRQSSVSFSYQALVRGAGEAVLPGYQVTVEDAQGFFAVDRFIADEKRFRVLPAFAAVNESQPIVKRLNSLPQHGIHRMQRAGLGSELLELREYVPGDPPKSIAWKVSARRQTLMTRQYESEVPVRVMLFVDGSISARIGGFGCRLLDQMIYVTGSVAKSAVSVGDPVGAYFFDERGTKRIAASGGDKGFYRLLEGLSDFAVNPPPPAQRLSPALMAAITRLCGERFPELLDPKVNQVPFTWTPIRPAKRRERYQRSLLAGILAEAYMLSPTQVLELIHDDNMMANYAQRFLADAGISWMDPLVQSRDRGFHDGMATMEFLSKALAESVAHARDNEVYVITANLLECATNISHLLPAVKMALARHHRVVFIVPTPTFRRPSANLQSDQPVTVESLLNQAQDLRTKELTSRLQSALHRVGARVSLSGEEEAIRMVMAETALARNGRVSQAGAR